MARSRQAVGVRISGPQTRHQRSQRRSESRRASSKKIKRRPPDERGRFAGGPTLGEVLTIVTVVAATVAGHFSHVDVVEQRIVSRLERAIEQRAGTCAHADR